MNKWIAHESNGDKDINLFAFPHAGGTAAFFATWGRILKDISILPVQYPMREKRIREKLQDSLIEMAHCFVDESIDLIKDKKFAFIGHCSGSIVAYEAAKYLKEKYNIQPEVLFVSSCYSPENYSAPILSNLSNDKLLEVIKESGFVSEELINEPIMFEYFAPIVKKDFYLQENYKAGETVKLNSQIVCMYGKEDEALSKRENISDWRRYTDTAFYIEEFNGSHFYLEKEIDKVGEVIENHLIRRD
ncbi:thioesterase domain-containing protein [Eubacterium sp.]|uniref:thioesterase II family protein n=1 Tax=Eubacterium sp. TaxID=142586 RepID=UPI0025872391|nr:thioesterase domain-containing protein [Eubacterium sp.]MCR5367793.1 hypothetical protein [Eubacterium sp.]